MSREEEKERLEHWHTTKAETEEFVGGEETDFGKGLLTCIFKWGQHFADIQFQLLMALHRYLCKPTAEREAYYRGLDSIYKAKIDFFRKSYMRIYGDSEEKAFSEDIALWMNGAADHLFEIYVPPDSGWEGIEAVVTKLRDKAMDMRVPFGERVFGWGDVEELQYLTQRLIILVDIKIGLQPDWGKW